MNDRYDVVVAGGGLGGMTAAVRLAQCGRKVLLAEQHFQLGGLATYFKRKSHVFDVALHGFPIGMKKSFKRYWGKDFAAQIRQVKRIRFENPQFQLETTFDKEDFTRILVEEFKIEEETVNHFFDTLKAMNFYDDRSQTTQELFEQFFPGRKDVWRLLMEPITYANGSTLQEPAITYGIVFGNFMSKGVYIFEGGTDLMIEMMEKRLQEYGVDVCKSTKVEKILVTDGNVTGAIINGKEIATNSVVSNGSLVKTVRDWVGEEHFDPEFVQQFSTVKLSNSSCQVYIGIKPGEKIDDIGDLIFTSTHPEFDSNAICSKDITSRTYSVYYPSIRPGSEEYTIVASMNAEIKDWQNYSQEEYKAEKQKMIEATLDHLERYIPNIRTILDYTEAATPRTFQRYTGHIGGASFGTKFEGLDISTSLMKQVGGLFHTGSVGIIMSGWLGAANYGNITANDVDKYLNTLR